MKRLTIALIILTGLLIMAIPVFAQDESPTGTITGRIVNGTSDGVVPESLDLMLHAWDENFDEKLMLDGKSGPDGSFQFDGIAVDPDLLYAVMLTYGDTIYASEPTAVQEGQMNLSLEIPIYEATTDSTAVKVSSQHVFFDATPDGLLVGEIYVLSNMGDRTIKGDLTDPDALLTPLQFSLPAEATNVSFENDNQGRFVVTPGGFADTLPLRPGNESSQVAVTYVLPYEESLNYSLISRWPVEQLTFLLTSGIGLSLEGENLIDMGIRNLGTGNEVAVFNHAALEAGESVKVSLSGTLVRPVAAPEGQMESVTTPNTPTSNNGLILGGAALGLALLIAGIWWYRRPETQLTPEGPETPTASFDELVAQIASLDQSREQGELSADTHARRRLALIEEARSALALIPEQ